MVDHRKISGKQLTSYFQRINSELGVTNKARLELFVELPADSENRFTQAAVFAALFPDQEKRKAQENFKKLRQAVNQAAETADCSLRLLVDGGRSADLTKRYCWFEVDPSDMPEISRFADNASRPIDPGDERSLAVSPGPPIFEIFVSYAHDNRDQAVAMLALLRNRLKVLTDDKPYRVQIWIDREAIDVGSDWMDEIQRALQRTRLGLLLLSVEFLSSDFITDVERKFLFDRINEKAIAPVMLCHFSPEIYENALGEIQQQQIYRYTHSNKKSYAWNKCTTKPIKDGFADYLAVEVVKLLDAQFEREDKQSDGSNVDFEKIRFADQAAEYDPALNPSHVKKSRARAGSLGDVSAIDDGPEGNEVVAVDHLMQWAATEPTIHTEFFAVLGEFGIGKTTSLRQFAQSLLKARKDDSQLPMPILLDLRRYTPAQDISLESVLSACIKGVQPTDGKAWTFDASTLIQSVRNESAIVIYDGLDEVMNGLDPKRRQVFIRELWSILPPLPRQDLATRPQGRGRIVMSCRSHFFRDVIEQNGIYTGNQREGIQDNQRQMLLILPFSETQVQSYLQSCLGEEQGNRIFELLSSIHNLIDLAKRPVLANMIREIVPDLERMMLDGKTILGVDLYDRFIRKHLERDEGKHVFSKMHKLRMMEALAADMWISGARVWSWERLEEWIDEFLGDNPSIARRYDEAAEVLNQDFRNATAVVRSAESKSEFRFAHTSLQEYFLACWMRRVLAKNDLDRFVKLPMPSDETLVFFGQLLQQADSADAIDCLAELMRCPQGVTAVIGFRYSLLATTHGYPVPVADKLELANADLYRWDIRDLKLQNVDLSGARLAESSWENVSIKGGSLAAALATQTSWCNCQLSSVDTNALQSDSAQFRYCEFLDMQSPNGWHVASAGCSDTQFEIATPVLKLLREGHSGVITCVTVDAERGRYISGSDDNTLKVWDAQTQQCVATLEGHGGLILSVTVDAERGRYISGSSDKTLKVWDARTLQCIATYYCLPDNEWATINNCHPQSVQRSTQAAAHLKWVGREVHTDKLVATPFEGLLGVTAANQ